MFTERDYQIEARRLITAELERQPAVAIEMATGLGKTVIFTKIASQWKDGRTLIICPQITLLEQAARKIHKETGIWPALEQGDMWSRETYSNRNPFVVASKDSLCSKQKSGARRYERFIDIGLVVVDEAHYAATALYKQMVDFFRDQGARVLGVSATLKRHDGKAIGQVFDSCVMQYGILDGTEDGWLAPVRVTCKQLKKLDLTDVADGYTPHGRDFVQQQLIAKLEDRKVIYEICEAVAQETAGQKTAIYCASVNEAQAVAEYLRDRYKFNAEWICADTSRVSKDQRKEILKRFMHGGVTHLCNVGILSVGWDYPGLECLVMARPTKSLPLYTQIFGRITRPAENSDGVPVVDGHPTPPTRMAAIASSQKPYGRIIDLVDASLHHKIVTSLDVLGGRWTLEERQRTFSRLLDRDGPQDANEQQAEVAVELRRERERIAREQRAAKLARAEFHSKDVDPFAGRRSEQKQRTITIPATPAQRRYLWILGLKDVDQYSFSKATAGRMIGQLKSGWGVDRVKRNNRLYKSTEPMYEFFTG